MFKKFFINLTIAIMLCGILTSCIILDDRGGHGERGYEGHEHR